jgi:hypothetical protein
VKRLGATLLGMVCVLALCCSAPRARSEKCFDDISEMVRGKTASEVEKILGEPDSREPMVVAGERWIWWNYTYLDGNNYAPEERGRVVHLEIIFEPEVELGHGMATHADLRVSGPLGVSYAIPKETM